MNDSIRLATSLALVVGACSSNPSPGSVDAPGVVPDAPASDAPSTPPPTATVTIAFDSTQATPLASGFAAANTPALNEVAEYDDPNFLAPVEALAPGTVRFPGGTVCDAYNWQTGEVDTAMLATLDGLAPFAGSYSVAMQAAPLTLAKGGVFLTDYAKFATALKAHSVITVNGFTDTTASIQSEAAQARSLGIDVSVWETGNEPYYFYNQTTSAVRGSFRNGADYAAQMGAFATAIRAAYAGSGVTPLISAYFAGMYMGVQQSPLKNWDAELAALPAAQKYWNAVSIHAYPLPPNQTITDGMQFLNGVLDQGADAYMQSYFLPLIGPNMPVYITELGSAGASDPFSSYHFAGLFAAEYVTRMSKLPYVKAVLVHSLYLDTEAGMIRAATPQDSYAIAHGPLDTSTLDFGFYLSAPGTDMSVVYQAVNHSTATLATTVTGGATVTGTFAGGAPYSTIPAVYAQAYAGTAGEQRVVVINKGATAQTALISATTGTAVPATINTTTAAATGGDPASVNAPGAVLVQAVTATAPSTAVPIPAYSVVAVEWQP